MVDDSTMQAERGIGVAGFDLDEDSSIDTVVGDPNADGLAEVAVFDLDEDTDGEAVAFDANADGTVDVVAFDLDEDRDIDVVAIDINADGVTEVVSGVNGFALDERDVTADQLGFAQPNDGVVDADEDEDNDLSDDFMCTPPDAVTDDDVHQAQQDEAHTQLMGEYMYSQGVIDNY